MTSSVSAVAHEAFGSSGQNTIVRGSHGASTVNDMGDDWYYTYTDSISVLDGSASNTKTVKIPQRSIYIHSGSTALNQFFPSAGVFRNYASTSVSDGSQASDSNNVYKYPTK